MLLRRVLCVTSTQLCQYGQVHHQVCRLLSTSFNLKEIREDFMQLKGGSVDLDLDDKSGVATITLNNAEKMNAMSGHMMVELADQVTRLESWKGKAVILRGANNTFCSGGDLTTVDAIIDPLQGQRMSLFMQDTTNRLSNLPLISFALIEGRALGGGAELPMVCDFRFMTPSAKLGFVQSRMGVTPGWGGGTRLVNLIGRTKALELLCTGRVLDTKTALDIGLVNHVLEDGENTLEEARTLITKKYCSAGVLRAVKSVVNAGSDARLLDSLQNEWEVFGTVWGGTHHLEAMNKRVKHD